jgi:hypothetical protein
MTRTATACSHRTSLDYHARVQRSEEDVTAIVTAVIEIRDDVLQLKRAVQALLTHQGLAVSADE